MTNLIDDLLNDSRLSPSNNGNPDLKSNCDQPTSNQKWWAAILLGFLFALVSSPLAYLGTNYFFTHLGGANTTSCSGSTLFGLFIHTIVFILLIRLILW